MNEGMEISQHAPPVYSTNTNTEANVTSDMEVDINRKCYCDQIFDIPVHPCAWICGRCFDVSCVTNTVFDNEWLCNKYEYRLDMIIDLTS